MYRWEQRTLLCFARLLYTTLSDLSRAFSKKLFLFSDFWFLKTHDINVHVKDHQKKHQKKEKFLICMLFHKNFRRFSSYLMIYKSTLLLYNIICWRARVCQVPLFCTLQICFCEMSSLWHPCVKTVRCAIFIFWTLTAIWLQKSTTASKFSIWQIAQTGV